MATALNGRKATGRSNSWRRWVEPWYLTYTLQGVVIAGLLPILLPLKASLGGNVAHVGMVMAALSVGGLSAPLWGSLADHYRLHRWLLAGGMFITAGSLLVFSLAAQPALWGSMALLLGLGAASTATVANLFIVEFHPKAEWDQRIGWLQTFYGVGQVGGLLAASIFSQINLQIGLTVSAGLCLFAGLLGWFTTRQPGEPLKRKPILLHPPRLGDWAFISPQRLFHHLNLRAIKKIIPALRSKFGLFLVVWVLVIGGSGTFFSQYPLVMQNLYGISPAASSTAFAIVAGLGLALYSPAGTWSEKYGSERVMRAALGVRWLAYGILFGLGFLQFGFKEEVALFALIFVVCAWSVISVSGTALAAQLTAIGEGEGLGIFNATNSLAGVVGASLGGWIAGTWGYNYLPVPAVIGIALGLALTLFLPAAKSKSKKET